MICIKSRHYPFWKRLFALVAIASGLQRLFLGGAGALAAPAQRFNPLLNLEQCGEALAKHDEPRNLNIWVMPR
jgi:hypothetical protein